MILVEGIGGADVERYAVERDREVGIARRPASRRGRPARHHVVLADRLEPVDARAPRPIRSSRISAIMLRPQSDADPEIGRIRDAAIVDRDRASMGSGDDPGSGRASSGAQCGLIPGIQSSLSSSLSLHLRLGRLAFLGRQHLRSPRRAAVLPGAGVLRRLAGAVPLAAVHAFTLDLLPPSCPRRPRRPARPEREESGDHRGQRRDSDFPIISRSSESTARNGPVVERRRTIPAGERRDFPPGAVEHLQASTGRSACGSARPARATRTEHDEPAQEHDVSELGQARRSPEIRD